MAENKTNPPLFPSPIFECGLSAAPRRSAAVNYRYASDFWLEPVMWGPSIIGFGTQHYKSDAGVGDMPRLAFSPRKAALTVYFTMVLSITGRN